MRIAERHRYITEKLHSAGAVSVASLAEEMGVSVVTVRKDLQLLEEQGLLLRSHGGASLPSAFVNDRPIAEKQDVRAEEKRLIAQAAAGLLQPDEAIIIGSGTTVDAFARALPRSFRGTVLTAALNVAGALAAHPALELVLLGGVVRKSAASAVGPYAEDMLRHFACNRLFLSVDGISPDFGLTTSNMMEAHLNAQMCRAAQQVVVLADASKFGKKGFGRICGLPEVDLIVTDAALPELYQEAVEAAGVKLLMVGKT
ncbi:DeoR/GlpR family DNA-binding transcription regulator [Phaeodactylibacter luteus]|uniref:DeoR/GlpR transcriptional regulator n=1 Tax=Phaeodactylibacter luteus TaxID=1564516 RepID=A0A5C6RJ81_9BACT|nr:DeoR/GlpR family DNA-binding transcription regulator [Phaeodactylibacter luteus]TXB62361.1 DeoR/GlpR transcriptional regulator [Phaeodactylibacter luteus]